MKFAVITPFSRYQFTQVLKDHLRPMAISWYPIVDKPYDFGEAWIRPYVYHPKGKVDPAYSKLNVFIDNGLEDETYYCVLNDDDFYKPRFFERIRTNLSLKDPYESIIVVSMLRGYNSIEYPGKPIINADTLFACSDNMKIGRVGVEQCIMQGKVLRNYRFAENSQTADGEFAERLKRSGLPIAYLPFVFVLFNYLEKRRWDKNIFQADKLLLSKILDQTGLSSNLKLQKLFCNLLIIKNRLIRFLSRYILWRFKRRN
jgi:hypothetical protein